MSRKRLMCTAICTVLGLPAQVALAQEAPVAGTRISNPFKAENNSPHCGFTYFTNGADNLVFRGSDANRCFDMKGGDDILILNREAFPNGVRVYSGSGRDTVWATDADDFVHDADGNNKEIRTFDGNDMIVVDVPIEEDPLRTGVTTGETRIFPGKGNNTIRIGRQIPNNSFVRRSPDAWITSEEGARDRVEATCGRPTTAGGFDIRSLIVPETSSISYETDGCSVGIFGLYGNADLMVSGGRLAVQTYSEGFRIPAGDTLPRLTGNIRGGIGLTLDIDRAHPDSLLHWEGSGNAFIRSRISKSGSGGAFHIRSARDVSYQGDMAAGDVIFSLAAKGVVKLDLASSGGGGRNQFQIAASRMEVSWRLAGDGGFPEISNDTEITYQETTFVLPQIDWTSERKPTAEALALEGIVDPDIATVKELPGDVPGIEEVRTEAVVAPGNTRLRLQLRRDNDRFGKCVSVSLIDHQGLAPERHEACEHLSKPLKRLLIEEASPYDEIIIKGDGVDLIIPINEASHFKVDRVEIDL